jgi:protein SCO1
MLRQTFFVKKIIYVLLILFALFSNLFAAEKPIKVANDVKLETILGNKIGSDIILTSAEGKNFTIGEFLSYRVPFILIPVYFDCPRLCQLVMSDVARLIRELPLDIKDEYRILTVSFDSTEKPEDALNRAKIFRKEAKIPIKSFDGWRFAVGTSDNTSKLMNQIGFKYIKDNSDFSHSASLFIVSPDGTISSVFSGISSRSWDIKMALIEASQGKIGDVIDHALLFCFRFDQLSGRYTLFAWNFVRVGSIATVILIFGWLVVFGRKKLLAKVLNKD